MHRKWVFDVFKVKLVCNDCLATLGERFWRLWDMLETKRGFSLSRQYGIASNNVFEPVVEFNGVKIVESAASLDNTL